MAENHYVSLQLFLQVFALTYPAYREIAARINPFFLVVVIELSLDLELQRGVRKLAMRVSFSLSFSLSVSLSCTRTRTHVCTISHTLFLVLSMSVCLPAVANHAIQLKQHLSFPPSLSLLKVSNSKEHQRTISIKVLGLFQRQQLAFLSNMFSIIWLEGKALPI